VGGGIRQLQDAAAVFDAGADKIAINSAAVRDPALIGEIARRFGSQSVVVAIDARKVDRGFEVFVAGGRVPTSRGAIQWAREAAAWGAGEILLTSMDRDGTKAGYDCELLRAVGAAVPVPVIASGGVGTLEHLYEGLADGGASAVLAASIFHFGQHTVGEAKEYLAARGISVRMVTTS